ncbi:hypothetical protein [Paraburkholderia sp. UCT2]|uniref:hypothetical protein n=1 Tax=Paraburkholderia sp. UCT2 TaxID=2615208 RepID=UPI0016555D6C|nr:hypothetical protein [Paraburkholderia sp. UCT2]MBC8729038.1 hypothetical protein [Paraburkholderia sp. UCT2]
MMEQNNHVPVALDFDGVKYENELLIEQLHQVQEELERCQLRSEALEKEAGQHSQRSISLGKDWVDDELVGALAECQHLRTVVKVQRDVHEVQTRNALNVKLGDLMIRGVDSPRALLALPVRLAGIWRRYRRVTAPESLGGKDFGRVIEAFKTGGFEAAEKLLLNISPIVQANAYTALSRYLIEQNRGGAAEAAHRAFALDPKTYRLKWLAFKLHKAGDVIQAQAMIDVLPSDTAFSESETRQANQLRNEAALARQRDAKQKTGYDERRIEVEKRLNRVTQERDQQATLAAERARQIDALKQIKTQRERDAEALKVKHQTAARLADEGRKEIDLLTQAQASLDRDKAALEARLDQATKIALGHATRIDELNQAGAQLAQDNAELRARHEDAVKLAAELRSEINSLIQAKVQAQAEGGALQTRLDETAMKLAHGCEQIELLKQSNAQLERDKAEAAKLAADCAKEVEMLKQGRLQLERDKATSEKAHRDAAAHTAVGQQLLREEVARAETQLELLKDILFRDLTTSGER